jgi:O-antigen/teichoic acid export membrane protein
LDNIKEKAQIGISLGLATQIGTQAAQFIFGLILARLLTPQDYGLVGMLAIFIALSDVFIDSGFGMAVMQKKNPEDSDYSTVFWFNLIVSVLAYIILFFGAPAIADFYGDERLILLTRVICTVVIINAFGSIQGKYLNKNMQYKKLAKIYVSAFLGSSIFAVIMAVAGFGVWSLVGKALFLAVLLNGGWWIISAWKPKRIFSLNSFKELGSFGSKILATSLFSSFFSNIYSVIIGKLFNAQSLGLFTRARQFYELPDKSIRSSSMNVFFPALSYMQDDNSRLINSYKKITGVYAYILFPLYITLAIIAKPLILVILTDKWIESVVLLQYFCLLAFALPFESVNENVLYIKGRSDFVFYVTVLKKVGLVAFLFLFYKTGLKGMVWAFVLEGYLGVFLSFFFAKKVIDFSIFSQIKQVLPSVGLTIIASLIMLIGMRITNTGILQLILVPLFGVIIYLTISYFIKRPELNEIISLVTGMRQRLKKQE